MVFTTFTAILTSPLWCVNNGAKRNEHTMLTDLIFSAIISRWKVLVITKTYFTLEIGGFKHEKIYDWWFDFSYNMYNFLFDAHSTSYEYPDFFFECTFNHYPDHSTKYYWNDIWCFCGFCFSQHSKYFLNIEEINT